MGNPDTPARLYLDHDVDARLAEALRRYGFDVVTSFEAGRHQKSDEAQVVYALEEDRILVTHNVRHFPSLHAAWLAAGRHHHGIIILIGYLPIGVWLQRLQNPFVAFSP